MLTEELLTRLENLHRARAEASRSFEREEPMFYPGTGPEDSLESGLKEINATGVPSIADE